MPITQKRISDHILWAIINRPEARNAIDFEMMGELEKLVTHSGNDPDLRLLIISGAGRDSFVSGGDLKKFHTITSEEQAVEMSKRMHDIFNRLEKLSCWTVACVNGDTYGGGIELMLACDFRVAMPNIKLGLTQGRFYLVPGWGGLTRLTEKVGKTKALEWLGKSEILSPKIALAYGLIEYILPGKDMESEVLEWSEELITNDRSFISALKKGAQKLHNGRSESLEAEIEPFSKLWSNEEHIKRVEKFLSDN